MDVVSAVHSDQLRSTSGAGPRLETRLGLEVAETVRHVCQYGLGHHVRYLHLEDQRRQVSTHVAYGVCVWQAHQQDGAAQGNQALSIVGTSVVIAAACIIFVLGTWYLHLRRQIWGKTVRLMSLIVLMAIAIGGKFCTRRVYLLFKKLIICTSHGPSDPHSSSIGRHAIGESCGSRRNRMDIWSALDDATLDPALYLGIGDL